MKKEVLDGVKKELKFKERIIVKVFSKTFKKVYNVARINTVNNLMQF